ncbi:MAG: NADH:flavin oxidoreductase/NADH oxidase [Pseudooceanicola nanhaiensis]|uniref:NADH:flavin oxidoreductase/NADH oxidase n=1 Tax=Rhodobacterales TaxID=204455 RepID=UPI004059B34B
MPDSLLFSELALRGLTLKNRVVISPMCQYTAQNGHVNDWHIVQYGRFAVGGAGLVFVEATIVSEEGRATEGDLGIWDDTHVAGLGRIAQFIRSQGGAAAIQLGHAGPKGSAQRPWHGMGPLGDQDRDDRGETPWPLVGPTAEPAGPGFVPPRMMTLADIETLRGDYRAATQRALQAGFDVVELHAAHGYLLHRFLSPLTNTRDDEYGSDAAGRMRLVVEIAADMREIWPDDRPVFVRLSASDFTEGGWTVEDSVALARALGSIGVDVIDCSSGGIGGSATAGRAKRGPGFQVSLAEQVRKEAEIATMAVGLITEPEQAERIVSEGRADLVAIGREALNDPNWPLHAAKALGAAAPEYGDWPEQHGWWLEKRRLSLSAR